MLVPIEAMLPKFYAVKTLSDNNGQLAFDMADGWDCQIFNVCLNYALKKNGGEFEKSARVACLALLPIVVPVISDDADWYTSSSTALLPSPIFTSEPSCVPCAG